ncbi:MAG: epoxyqueuosine reductase QueH [Desulfovibrionaceae bacterium]|nr:epoxyqueuosine reductase QueH [Desulfovibrionaceae bacterium]
MRILVHLCCGPCGITVLQRLLDAKGAGHELGVLFFNPNIQPLSEYMRRRDGASQVADRLGLPFIPAETLGEEEQMWDDPWLAERQEPDFAPGGAFAVPPAANPALWLRAVSGREGERCTFCWRIRLRKTAQLALRRGFDGYTSSLLYSRHQNHAAIRELGRSIAEDTGPAFVYEDFRTSWQEGIRLSKEWGIYRQQYCGCCFSEYDRYSRDLARQ